MGVSYEIVRKSHRVLTGLYEIQNLEAFLATVAADTKDQAPDEMKKQRRLEINAIIASKT
ncbi:MAG: hypothetical protein ABSF09_09020 [Candidatus Bathyarchaeia archaeon]